MTSFEILISIIGGLISTLGVIGTIFLKRLIQTLDTMSADVNGIKVEIGKIVTTQTTHEEKFEAQEKRMDKIEKKVFA